VTRPGVSAVRPPLLSVLVASALTSILVGRVGGPPAVGEGIVRSAGRAALAPVEAAGAAVFRRLDGAAAGLGRSDRAARLEKNLVREQEQARSEAARAEALAAENSRLAALLGLEGPAAGDGVAARVVSTGDGRGAGTLVLDRGTTAGLRTGMPVVAAGGLVGRVVEVGPRHSIVLPLTDPASAVGVRCTLTAPPGADQGTAAAVAQGRGGSTLRLDLLDPNAPLESGGLAVSSGLRHSRFPAGLPVGRVTGTRGHFVVHPLAPPDRLELVKVLRWDPEP
jgi:rod shape-determining protein MreC